MSLSPACLLWVTDGPGYFSGFGTWIIWATASGVSGDAMNLFLRKCFPPKSWSGREFDYMIARLRLPSEACRAPRWLVQTAAQQLRRTLLLLVDREVERPGERAARVDRGALADYSAFARISPGSFGQLPQA